MALPEFIIAAVLHEIVPRRNFAVKIFFVGVGESAHAQIPLEHVEAVERKAKIFARAFKQCRVLEAVGQTKCAIVKKIVAQPRIAHAGLLGDCFQRGMRIDHAHGDQIAGIGNSVHANPAIVVCDVFDQPVDRVVGVCAFVHFFGISRIGRGMQHLKFASGAVAPTNILKNKNVAVSKHVRVAIQAVAHSLVRSGNPIRRAVQQHWQRFFGVCRRVNFRVQLYAIADRNHHLALVE